MIWLGLYSSPFSRLNLRAIAALSSGMPSTAVYLEARPLSIALIAACLMLTGVSKSGSPAPSPITSRPAALSARALSVTAIVAEGWMRSSEAASTSAAGTVPICLAADEDIANSIAEGARAS